MSAAAVPASTYWETRARRFAGDGRGLRAVCSYGMPAFYNEYIHIVQASALWPWLRVPAGLRVLEVGCGVGRWSRRLAASGAHVIGIDLAPAMVAEARRRALAEHLDDRCEFLQCDAAELSFEQPFDVILCVTVLQHILDAERMQMALDRMSAHLAADGRIVLLEAAPSSGDTRCNSPVFTARNARAFHEAFARAGLRCLAMRGVDPLPLKTRFLPFYGRLPRPLALPALAGITAVSLPYDLLLGRCLPERSWHKVFVLTRT
jgi:SAM-dependent methyltransferase